MADTFASDVNESQLLDSINALNLQLNDPEKGLNTLLTSEEKSFLAQQKASDQRRGALAKQLSGQVFGDLIGKGSIAELEGYKEELAILQEGINLAKNQDPNGLSAGHLLWAWAPYLEKVNIDKAVMAWLNASKGKEQVRLEKFLFGEKLGNQKPPKIDKAQENIKAFESGDWVTVARIYTEEYLEREKAISAAEMGILELAGLNLKETFLPTQPDRTKLDALEKAQTAATEQLGQFQHRLDRYAYYRDQVWGPRLAGRQEAERLAQEAALNSVLQEEEDAKRKQEEIARAASGERVQPTTSSVAPATTHEQPPSRQPFAQREIAAMRARGAGGRNFGDYLKDPGSLFSDIGKLFRRVVTRQAAPAAQQIPPTPPTPENQTAGAVTGIAKTVVKKSISSFLKDASSKIITKLGLGAISGGIVTVALFIKDAIFSKKTREFIKNLLSRGTIAAGAAFVWLISNPLAGLFAAAGGTFGLFIGGPAGAAAGFGMGAFLGYQIGQALGIGTTATPVVSAATVPIATGLSSGFGFTTIAGSVTGTTSGIIGTIFGSGTGVVLTAVAGVSVGTIIAVTVAGSAFVSTLPAAASEGPKSIFVVEKSVKPDTSLSNNSGTKLTYSVTISNATDKDIKISNVTDVMTQETKDSTKIITSPTPAQAYPQTIAAGSAVTINFNPYSTDGITDSRLTNSITVTVDTETQTATAVTNIGSVPNNQPFGYPASGKIVSLDARFLNFSGVHKGTFFHAGNPNCTFVSDRCWIVGGMDILGAGIPVYSTIKGTVIYAAYDLGSTGSNGHCTNLSQLAVGPKFMDCAVGGVVVIQSGDYIVSFLHLASPSITAGTSVERGQQIGVTYSGQDGGIPTVDGWHVHYQILWKSSNFAFASAPVGSCSSGAILPIAPILGGSVTANQSSSCN